MLKRNINYVDFNGNEQTEVFYFNLTKAELVELEVSFQGGLDKTLQAIQSAEDTKTLIALFKRIVLDSYGEKSEDGKRFIKNDAMRDEFISTAAYSALFMELATDEAKALEFIQGILPTDLAAETQKQLTSQPPLPPPAGDA